MATSPFIWGSGGRAMTPDDVARERKIAEALMSAGIDTSPVAHPLQGFARLAQALSGKIREGRADRAETTGQQTASSALAGMFGGGAAGGTPAGPAPAAAAGVPAGVTVLTPTPSVGGGEIESYIRQAAAARGIDPDVAVRVARSEGGLNDPFRQGESMLSYGREESYGPFQLHMRGGGVGERALAAGIDPRKNWKGGIDYGLDEAAQKGWGQWFGAAKAGIGNRTGLGNARALGPRADAGGGVQVASLDPSIGIPPEQPVQAAGLRVGGQVPLPAPPGQPMQPEIAQPVQPQAIQPMQPETVQGTTLAEGLDGNSPIIRALLGQSGPDTASLGGAYPAPPPMPNASVGAPVAPDMPMGGGVGGGAVPAAPTAQTSQAAIAAVLDNPWASEGQKRIATALLQQQMEQQDPAYQMGLEKSQLELDALRTPRSDLINAGKGRLYDPNSGQWITAPDMGTDAPTVQSFYDNEGREYKAQWDAQARKWEPVGGSKLPSGMTLRTNPDGTVELIQGAGGAGQKLTEGQSKDLVYYTMGSDADAILATKDKELTDWAQTNADKLPLGIGNYLREPEFRQAKQAGDRFLTALLRKETGAAVTDTEWAKYGPMFLPVPGDDQGTIEQKRRGRQVALFAIKSGLGTAEAIAEANRIILGLPESQLPKAPVGQDKPVEDMTDEELEELAR